MKVLLFRGVIRRFRDDTLMSGNDAICQHSAPLVGAIRAEPYGNFYVGVFGSSPALKAKMLSRERQRTQVPKPAKVRPQPCANGGWHVELINSPTRITPANNGKIRPQPDQENAFAGVIGGGSRRDRTHLWGGRASGADD